MDLSSQDDYTVYSSLSVSVWLLPSADTAEFRGIQQFIQSSSQEFNSPCFLPHITLAALPRNLDLDIVETSFKPLIGEVLSYPVRFEGVQQGDTFYQSVFAKVHDSSVTETKSSPTCSIKPSPVPPTVHCSGSSTSLLSSLRCVISTQSPLSAKTDGSSVV